LRRFGERHLTLFAPSGASTLVVFRINVFYTAHDRCALRAGVAALPDANPTGWQLGVRRHDVGRSNIAAAAIGVSLVRSMCFFAAQVALDDDELDLDYGNHRRAFFARFAAFRLGARRAAFFGNLIEPFLAGKAIRLPSHALLIFVAISSDGVLRPRSTLQR
jgi:hypothetical protein